MTYGLVFTDQYNRRAARLLKRHPQLREPYRKTLLLLAAKPHHPSLRLHALSGRLDGLPRFRSICPTASLGTADPRDRQIVPINVGDHEAVS